MMKYIREKKKGYYNVRVGIEAIKIQNGLIEKEEKKNPNAKERRSTQDLDKAPATMAYILDVIIFIKRNNKMRA